MWLASVCFTILMISHHEIYRLIIWLILTLMSRNKVHPKVSPLQDKREGLMAPDERPELQLCVSTDTEISQTLELCSSDVSSKTEEEEFLPPTFNNTGESLTGAGDSTVDAPNDGDQSGNRELPKTDSSPETNDTSDTLTNNSEEKVINLSHLLAKSRQIQKRSGSHAAIDVSKASQISLRVKAKLQRQASVGSLHSQLQRQQSHSSFRETTKQSHRQCASDGRQSWSSQPAGTGSMRNGYGTSSWNVGHLPSGRTAREPSYASHRQRPQVARQPSLQGRSRRSQQRIEDSLGSRTSGRPQRVRRRATVGPPRRRRPPLERGLSASQISDRRILERLWRDTDD